jgi:DNA helicase-2/ATP-dependent DNA helicase PcrA
MPATPQPAARGGARTPRRKVRLKSLEELDREQRAAVTQPPGNTLVIAGAGTGKTRIVTRRTAFLIEVHDVEPGAILPITLTNKARIEMTARLRHLCGRDTAERIPVGTIHATCAGILRAHAKLIERTPKFSIYEKDDAIRVVRRALSEPEKAKIGPGAVLREISVSKNHDISLDEYAMFASDPVSRIVARVWGAYEAELRLADALDFDDLVRLTVYLLRTYPELRDAYREKYRHILVDEYQDTNPAAASFMRALADHDFMAVGDDKQVIFGFRLADVRLILEFDQEYPNAKVLTLHRNYRNSRQILAAANRLIAFNEVQRPMILEPAKKSQTGPAPSTESSTSDSEEAQQIAAKIQLLTEEGIPEREIAVLGRNLKVVERVERALAAAGIRYQLVGPSGYFRRDEVKRALAHLRLLVDPRNEDAFIKALSIRPKVGAKTIARIVGYAQRHHLNLLEASVAVDLIGEIRADQAENVRRFAHDMLAFTRRLSSASVSELTYDVIRMPFGVAESLLSAEDSEQEFARLEALREAALSYERQTDVPTLAGWLQDAMLAGRDDLDTQSSGGRVTLSTVHSVKGLEWEVVIAAGFEGATFPSFRARTKRAIEEERRVAYVLFTRPSRVLILSYAMSRDGRRSGPSPFIAQALGGQEDQRRLLPSRQLASRR